MRAAFSVLNTFTNAVDQALSSTAAGGGTGGHGLRSSIGDNSYAAQVKRLARQVAEKMDHVERETGIIEPSICGLYLHFFLSLLGIVESLLRYCIHLTIVCVLFAFYYILLCLTCGKYSATRLMEHHVRMLALYLSLSCACIGNVLLPWRPSAYGFHSLQERFTRPDDQALNLLDRHCCENCCSCQCILEGFGLPTHKLLQSSLIVFGTYRACSPALCCGEANPQCTSYNGFIAAMLREDVQEKMAATQTFYRTYYQCYSFQEFVSRETGVHPSAPIASSQPITYPLHAREQHQPQVPIIVGRQVNHNTDVPIVQATALAETSAYNKV